MTVQAVNGRRRWISFVHHSRAPITTTTRTAQAQQPLVQGHNNSGAKFRPHNACIASHETSHAILPATDAKPTDPVAPKQPTTRLTYIPHPATSGSAMRGQMLRWWLHTCSSHRSEGESVICVPAIDEYVMSLVYSYVSKQGENTGRAARVLHYWALRQHQTLPYDRHSAVVLVCLSGRSLGLQGKERSKPYDSGAPGWLWLPRYSVSSAPQARRRVV
jgi:hypothetical protein